MTKSTGVGRGGRRENAGRPKGAKNKRSHAEELVARAQAEALTMPIDWLLKRLKAPKRGNRAFIRPLPLANLTEPAS